MFDAVMNTFIRQRQTAQAKNGNNNSSNKRSRKNMTTHSINKKAVLSQRNRAMPQLFFLA